jgi:hypothetical protein
MKLPLDACPGNQKKENGHRKEDDRTEQEVAYDPVMIGSATKPMRFTMVFVKAGRRG